MRRILTKVFDFSASHRLYVPSWDDEENYKVFGKCSYPSGHGHNYELHVSVSGEADPQNGMIINATSLKQIVQESILRHVDHRHLNVDVPWLRDTVPTCEVVANGIWNQLEPSFTSPGGITLERVVLWETKTIYVSIERSNGRF